MIPTITAFERSPDHGRGLARDMRVRWALEEVGQPYEVRLVSFNAMKQPAHLSLQPFGQIPTYEDGDLSLFESGAIVLHIAERHPGLPGEAKRPGDSGDNEQGRQNLQSAQPEHDAFHGHKARQGEFEADGEHQEHDAELGKVLRTGKAAKQIERMRADQRTDNQIAEHRRQIHAPEEDDGNHRSAQQHQDDRKCVHGFRVSVGSSVKVVRGVEYREIGASEPSAILAANHNRCTRASQIHVSGSRFDRASMLP